MISACVLLPAFILALFARMISAIPPPLPSNRQFWENYCSASSNIDQDVRYICFQTTSGGDPQITYSKLDDVNLATAALDPKHPDLTQFVYILGSPKDDFTFSMPGYTVDVQATQAEGCVLYRINKLDSLNPADNFFRRHCRGDPPVSF
ncbi:uncharacterized protein UTRI_04987_B [Ustilago trichophora]|uniref:Mig1 protein n=1 Tax=Ustilago trichophora TaxID=86804 RepID=A0A5C3EFY4_9BASI|nr:uncharacterized protein UTRI_04987_B [Ustilago trichophora]